VISSQSPKKREKNEERRKQQQFLGRQENEQVAINRSVFHYVNNHTSFTLNRIRRDLKRDQNRVYRALIKLEEMQI